MATDRKDLIALIVDWLGVAREDFKTFFDTRKAVQKIIYLQQAKGFNLGYDYGLYIHGPYCPQLADDVYAVIERKIPSDEGKASEAYKEFLGFINRFKQDGNYDPLKLELWATLVFLHNESYLDLEECIKWFNDHKPHFDDEVEIRTVYDELKGKGFLRGT